MEHSPLQEFILRYHYALKSPALAGQSVMAWAHGMPFHGPFFPEVTQETAEAVGLSFPLPEPVYAKSKPWCLKSREVQVLRKKRDKKGRGTYTMTVTETSPLKSYEDLFVGFDVWLEGEDCYDKVKAMPPEERGLWTMMGDIPPTKEQEEEAYQAWKKAVLAEPPHQLPEPLPPIPEHG